MSYCPKHDAFFDKSGWKEKKCSDLSCEFCSVRPDAPACATCETPCKDDDDQKDEA